MTVPEYRVADEPGAGDRSEIEDIKTGDKWETKDQRAETRTTFWERDIDSLLVSDRRKRELKRALRRQEGEQDGETYSTEYQSRNQQNRQEWRRRMVTTYASQLDLTDAQKSRVLHLIEDVLSITSFGSYSVEEVILATINVVAREDRRMLEDEDRFRAFVRDVGIRTSEGNADMLTMRRLRTMVRERVPSKSA